MAAIPPQTAAEIQKLEQLHGEHPEGRYFVPLGDRYRKLGMIEQAETLLREGLRRHPDYLSAHIVLGGCLADRGVIDEAAEEFRYVLGVDPQNLIALRTLGELAAAGGRGAEAERWYRELLAVDPMNKEAKQALEVLSGEAKDPHQTHGESSDPESWETRDHASFNGARTIRPEVENEDDWLLDEGSMELVPGGNGADHAAPSGGGDEPREGAPDAAEEFDALAFGDVALEGDASGGPEQPDLGADFDAVFKDLEPDAEDEEVITETIAELYTRQGFHDRAADVYRELIRRRGESPTLQSRLAQAERAAGGESDESWADALILPDEPPTEVSGEAAGLPLLASPEMEETADADGRTPSPDEWLALSFQDGFADASPGVDPEREAEPEEAPRPVAIRAALVGLLRWSPEGTVSDPGPEAGAFSPAPVLSDEGLEDGEPHRERSVAAGAEVDTPAAEEDDSDLSWLSDILGEPAASAGVDQAWANASPQTDLSVDKPSQHTREEAATAADDDDLESFQAWLQSLKR